MERLRVSSGAVWEPAVGYSRAVRVGDTVAVSGTTSAGPDGTPVGGDDVGAQAREALRRIGAALAGAGAGLDDVVRTRIFVIDISRWEEVGRVHGEVFGDVRPATSMVQVAALIAPELLVEIEADAVVAAAERAAPAPSSPGSLAEVRRAIDGIDDQVVALLARRGALVRRAAAWKPDEQAVRDPARVAQVIARVRQAALEHGAHPDVVERTYRAMVDAFVEVELDVHLEGPEPG